MSQNARRLRRIGDSRATIRHKLNATDAARDAQRFGVRLAVR